MPCVQLHAPRARMPLRGVWVLGVHPREQAGGCGAVESGAARCVLQSLSAACHGAMLRLPVLEYCLLRLDSPIFNAPPAEPLADPVTEPAALPFTATGKLTYSHGMHLKYATSAWGTIAAAAAEAAVAMTGGPGECFPKLRAMAQVLLLPKDLLADQERELRQEADKELQAACLNYCKGAQDVLISMKKKAAEQARNDTAAVYQRLQDQIANYINLAKKTDIGTKNSKLTDNLTFFKDRVISEFKDAMSVFVMETNLSEIHVKEQKKEIDEKKAAAAEEAENLPVDPSVREIAKQEVAKAVAKLKSTPPPHHRRAAANNAANNNDKKKNMKQKQVKQTKQKKTFPVKNNRKPFAVNAAKKPNTAAAKKPTNGKKRKNGSTNHSGRAFTKAAGRSVNHPTKKTSPAKNGGGSGRGGTARQ
ncbi:unnamed protein product [Closterium sp. NIES-64]|nr:unnamed protein product [Closterium sp. NIES-64]